ncbi:MAG: serine/threonine protein kinase [Prevotellaceae bacterium]|jgi:serine/threonine protein kinase|nr:serine/threonine protein kinase [Prevotellaceae bacterium]
MKTSETGSYATFKARYHYTEADYIGGGRYGKVYKALDTKQQNRKVAVKEPTREATHKYRLKEEIDRIIALPEHSNVATYFDYYTFVDDEGVEKDFIVMQYYQEGSLRALMREKKLSLSDKEAILLGILDGLEFLHKHERIHRDLKPENILISQQGERFVPKISDFGICKEVVEEERTLTDVLNSEVGTPIYSSPEQLLDQTIRANTDLWNFGIIAYEVFTGEDPRTCQRVHDEERFNWLLDAVPWQWLQLMRRCLTPDADARVPDVAACRSLLTATPPEEYIEDDETLTEAGKETPPVVPPKRHRQADSPFMRFVGRRRQYTLVVLAAVIAIAIMVIALFALNGSNKKPVLDADKANKVWQQFH